MPKRVDKLSGLVPNTVFHLREFILKTKLSLKTQSCQHSYRRPTSNTFTAANEHNNNAKSLIISWEKFNYYRTRDSWVSQTGICLSLERHPLWISKQGSGAGSNRQRMEGQMTRLHASSCLRMTTPIIETPSGENCWPPPGFQAEQSTWPAPPPDPWPPELWAVNECCLKLLGLWRHYDRTGHTYQRSQLLYFLTCLLPTA